MVRFEKEEDTLRCIHSDEADIFESHSQWSKSLSVCIGGISFKSPPTMYLIQIVQLTLTKEIVTVY